MKGQQSASATFTASVNIIKPIEIRTISNLNFANIDASNGGSVILNPDNSRSANGGIKLENSQMASAASFEIKGQNGYAYSVNVPQGDYIMQNGSQKIILKDFRIAAAENGLNSDNQTFNLGATIDVQAQQKPGRYITPTPLEITVSYN